MIFRKSSFMLIFLMNDGTQDSVIQVFDTLSNSLGTALFKRLFGVILTDNGIEFKNPNDVEHTRPELIRIYVFFYDPQASWQKPHVENNHKLIRRIIPKGTSSMSRTHDLFAVISAVPYVTTLMAKHHLI